MNPMMDPNNPMQPPGFMHHIESSVNTFARFSEILHMNLDVSLDLE